ncbi:MAG: AI-2E family transporter, partial [Clostridiales Family XIII bacterium]|jgi:predicted PurR-regulated permease PerM|nr:AI-2E family transporter [Clostridiales Family XIII bacterium]
MVFLIHVIEAYVLNPKLMANRTQLPVCLVFMILLVAEKYLGVWGLLIGVPVFIFLMTILGVDFEEACKPEAKLTTKERLLRVRAFVMKCLAWLRRVGHGGKEGGGDD